MSDKGHVAIPAVADPRLRIDPPVPVVNAITDVKRDEGLLQMLAIAVLLCAILCVLAPNLTVQVADAARLTTVKTVGVLLVAWILSVVWHELGHLVAALLAGFQITGAALGPVRGTRLDGKWTVKWSSRTPFAASISAIPHRSAAFDTANWRRGMLSVVAGGPVATAIGAALSYTALRYAAHTPIDRCFFANLTELNALIFLMGLAPNPPDAPVRNDAGLLLSLMRAGTEAHAMLLYHLLAQLRSEGFRPCFYPDHVIRAAARAHASADFRAYFAQCVVEWALDRGQTETAAAWDEYALEVAATGSARVQSQALANSAVVDLLIRADIRSAANKCAEANMEALTPEWVRHRTEAVAHLSARNILDGLGELQRMEYSFPAATPYFEFQKFIIQWLRKTAKLLAVS